MIMLSRDEFVAVKPLDSCLTADQEAPSAQHRPSWPVNEFILQNLIRGGKSGAEIAKLYDVGADQVARLRSYHNV